MATYRLRIDLANLNSTANYLFQKNSILRHSTSNPLNKIFDNLINPARKVIAQSSLQKIIDEMNLNVVYQCEGHASMDVAFYLSAVGADNRLINLPSVVVMDKSEQYLHTETIESNDPQKDGIVFNVHFYAYLGKSFPLTEVGAPIEND